MGATTSIEFLQPHQIIIEGSSTVISVFLSLPFSFQGKRRGDTRDGLDFSDGLSKSAQV